MTYDIICSMCVSLEQPIHLGQPLDSTILDVIADFICGDIPDRYPVYRSSSYLTRFFQDLNINAVHDGSTRKWWVLDILKQLSASDHEKIVLKLVDLKTYKGSQSELKLATKSMNEILLMDGLCIKFNGIIPGIYKLAKEFSLDANEITKNTTEDEKEFLSLKFDDNIEIAKFNLDSTVSDILQSRVKEIRSLPIGSSPLAAIFLIGSTLEGLLLGVMLKDQARFSSSKKIPTLKNGKPKKLYDLTLNEMIIVASDEGVIGKDVQKFSHALRDFRNYIHPYRQLAEKFDPNSDTANICWQVFKAAYNDLLKCDFR